MTREVKFVVNDMFAVCESDQGTTFLAGGNDMVYHATKVTLPNDNNKYRLIINKPIKDMDIVIDKRHVTFLK